jgi:hypothetical protein
MIRKTADAKSTHLIQCSFARCQINDRVNSSSAFTKSEGNVKNKLAPISLFLSGTGKHHLTIHWSLFKHKCFSLITLHFFQDFNSGYKRNDRGHNNKTRIHPIRLDVVIVFNKKKNNDCKFLFFSFCKDGASRIYQTERWKFINCMNDFK